MPRNGTTGLRNRGARLRNLAPGRALNVALGIPEFLTEDEIRWETKQIDTDLHRYCFVRVINNPEFLLRTGDGDVEEFQLCQ
jgi:hypothetical protein